MPFPWVELVRVIHVLAAAMWVGGAFFALVIVGPGVRAAGPAGQEFMKAVARRGGPMRVMGPAAGTTILTGLLLFWQRGYLRAPFGTPSTSFVTVGALIGLGVLVVGMTVGMPLQRRMAALATQLGPGGPTPEQKTEMARLGGRMGRIGTTSTWLLVAALVLMVGRDLA